MTLPPESLGGFVLDTAALLELGGGPNLYASTFADTAAVRGLTLLVPAAALSEAWQIIHCRRWDTVRLAAFLQVPTIVVEPLGERAALRAGTLVVDKPGTAPDVPAAQVATACHTRGWPALSGEPARLLALDPHLSVEKLPGI